MNLPGNPRGVEICFTAIADMIPHALNILQGTRDASEDWGSPSGVQA
jgi:hypothetical protein